MTDLNGPSPSPEARFRNRTLPLVLAGSLGAGLGLTFPEVPSDMVDGVFFWFYGADLFWRFLVPTLLLPAGTLFAISFHFPDRRAALLYVPVFLLLMIASLALRHAPQWPVALVVMPAVGISLAALAPTIPLAAAWRRHYLAAHSGPRCLQCDYLLLGNSSGVCSECGQAFSPSQFGLTAAELTPTDPHEIDRVMAIPHRRQPRYGLIAQLLFVLLAFYGMGFATNQMTPPGPRIYPFWWPLTLVSAGASLFTAVRSLGPRAKKQPLRFAHAIAAFVTLGMAGYASFSQIETLGTDMWRIPHRRVSLLRERLGFAFGFMDGKPSAESPKPGDPMDPDPPDLEAPLRFNTPVHDSRHVPIKTGPCYQRYLDESDLETIGYRPTPTWTYDPDIILVYTPRPIMMRKWFRPVPDAWVAFHGNGKCVTHKSADALARALEKDNHARAKMNLPTVPFEVQDR